jgi:hypothetical protein
LQKLSVNHGERYDRKKQCLLNKQKQELLGLETRLDRDKQELESQRDSELEIIRLRFKKNKRVVDNELGVLESRTRNLLGKHNNVVHEGTQSHFYANMNHESLQSRPFKAPISVNGSMALSEIPEPALPTSAQPGSSLLFSHSPTNMTNMTANTSPKRAGTTLPTLHSPHNLRSSLIKVDSHMHGFTASPRSVSSSASFSSYVDKNQRRK